MNKLTLTVLIAIFSLGSSVAEAGTKDIRYEYQEAMLSAISSLFTSGMGAVGNLTAMLFVICTAVAFFQLFSDKIDKNDFLLEWVKLIFRMALVMAILGQFSFKSFDFSGKLFNSNEKYIDVAVYKLLQREFNSIAKNIEAVSGPDKFQEEVSRATKLNMNMINAVFACPAPAPPECFLKALKQNSVQSAKEDTAAQNNAENSGTSGDSKGVFDKMVDSVTPSFDFGPVKVITTAIADFIMNPVQYIVLFLMKALMLGLELIRTIINYFVLIVSGLMTVTTLFFCKLIAPFMIIPSFYGRVIGAYKIPMSTALYGFITALIIALSTAVIRAINIATYSVLTAKLSQGTGVSGIDAAHMITGNFSTMIVILAIQIAALKNVPGLARGLLNLSLEQFVDLGKQVVDAGLGTLKLVAGAAIGGVALAGGAAAGAAASGASAYGAAKATGAGTMEAIKGSAGAAFRGGVNAARTINSSGGGLGGLAGFIESGAGGQNQGSKKGSGLSSGGSSGIGGDGPSGGDGGGGGSGGGAGGGSSSSVSGGAKSVGLKNQLAGAAIRGLSSVGGNVLGGAFDMATGGSYDPVAAGLASAQNLAGKGLESFGGFLGDRAAAAEKIKEIKERNLGKLGAQLNKPKLVSLGEEGIEGLRNRIANGTAGQFDYENLNQILKNGPGSLYSDLHLDSVKAKADEDMDVAKKILESQINNHEQKIKTGSASSNDLENIFKLTQNKKLGFSEEELTDSSNQSKLKEYRDRIESLTKNDQYREFETIRGAEQKRAIKELGSFVKNKDGSVSAKLDYEKSGRFIELENKGLLTEDALSDVNVEGRSGKSPFQAEEREKINDALRKQVSMDKESAIKRVEGGLKYQKGLLSRSKINPLMSESEKMDASIESAVIDEKLGKVSYERKLSEISRELREAEDQHANIKSLINKQNSGYTLTPEQESEILREPELEKQWEELYTKQENIKKQRGIS